MQRLEHAENEAARLAKAIEAKDGAVERLQGERVAVIREKSDAENELASIVRREGRLKRVVEDLRRELSQSRDAEARRAESHEATKAELEELKSAFVQAKARCGDMEVAAESSKATIRRLESSLKIAEDEAEQKERERRVAEDLAERLKASAESTSDASLMHQKRAAELEKEVNRLTAAVDMGVLERDAASAERDEVKLDLISARAAVEEIEIKLKFTVTEKIKLESSAAASNAEIERLASKLSHASDMRDQWKLRYDEAVASSGSMREDHAEALVALESRCKKALEDSLASSSELARCRSQLAAKENQAKMLVDDVSSLRLRISEMKEAAGAMSDEKKRNRAETMELRADIGELRCAREREQRSVTALLRSASERIESYVAEQRTQGLRILESYDKRLKRVQEYAQRVFAAKARADLGEDAYKKELVSEIEDLRTLKTVMMPRLQQELEKASKARADVERTNKALLAQNRQLKLSEASARELVVPLEERARESVERAEEAEKKASKLQSDIDALNASVAVSKEENGRLRSSMQASITKKGAAMRQLEALRLSISASLPVWSTRCRSRNPGTVWKWRRH